MLRRWIIPVLLTAGVAIALWAWLAGFLDVATPPGWTVGLLLVALIALSLSSWTPKAIRRTWSRADIEPIVLPREGSFEWHSA